MEDVYYKNLNDRYLSLALGTENYKFKFRNINEENVYKAEDKLYEHDTQIDNTRRSYKVVNKILKQYEELSEQEKANYKFPVNQLNPLRFYWDHKFRKSINEQYFKEGKITKEKDLKALKKVLSDRLDYLKTGKTSGIGEIKENFRKNFTKSLDHKSF